jgi:DNA invertase Pin-like site-specific DNA recombinase
VVPGRERPPPELDARLRPNYARVSTDAQDLEGQVEALHSAGADRVVREVASGARRDRPALRRLLERLDADDVLLVHRLDRLARSTAHLFEVLDTIAERGATFRSIQDGWADTTTPHGQLLITVLSGLAEFERSLIKARTAEGRARAKARGVRMGRRPKLTPHQQRACSTG